MGSSPTRLTTAPFHDLRPDPLDHRDHIELLRGGVGSADPTGADWADLGSGRGAFTLALADLLGPGGRIVSIDRDAGALREQAGSMAARFPATAIRLIVADFTDDLTAAHRLAPFDGIVMANSLHFHADHGAVVRHVAGMVRPGGRFVLVEYDADRGNPWVPHPLSFETWRRAARAAGLTEPRLIGRVPSRFLGAIYSAVADRPDVPRIERKADASASY